MSQNERDTLVRINTKQNVRSDASPELSRRGFLKILGSTAAVGAAGCAEDVKQTIFPYVKGEPEQIPGQALWYRSTCTECTAGCGIMVRTREGRAVKIEGSPDSPINEGGLCALGQSALQALYDPDRVRQPLRRAVGTGSPQVVADTEPRKNNYAFASWSDALKDLSTALKENKRGAALITGEHTGALDDLISSFCSAHNIRHVVWDPMQPTALARASELAYGVYGIPSFKIDKAEVVLNFGADFLETWISPVQFARAWAKTRKSEHPVRVVHVEPRLSLSGANADLWLSAAPGTELSIALYLLKAMLDNGKGQNLNPAVRDQIESLVKGVSIDTAAQASGVSKEKLALVSEYLKDASSSLVIAGGTAATTSDPLSLQLATCFLNLVLGNVGKTVDINSVRKPKSSQSKMIELINDMSKGSIGVVLVHGTNPAFTLPASLGFENAVRTATKGDGRIKLFSLSSHIDETSQLADAILPSSHSLESWGDARPVSGVYGLIQPSMTNVFDTRSLGDILLNVSELTGQSAVSQGAKDFEAYLKASWQKLHAGLNVGGDFEKFWLQSVERGGYFSSEQSSNSAKVNVSADAFKPNFKITALSSTELASDEKTLALLPYYSVRTFDGRAANRPWLQELPDPVTTAVWGSWAEVHPETAAHFGLEKDDYVTLRTKFGEINIPVYITPYVHKDVVAVPVGQGHTAYGRYAMDATGGNVVNLLPPLSSNGAGAQPMLVTQAAVKRGRGKAQLLILQGSDSQHGRGIGKTTMVAVGAGAAKAANAVEGGAHHGEAKEGEHGEGEHENIKQMYVQREHPIYQWGLAVDLAACTGCAACVVACYAENNIPVVGREQVWKGREMSWLRIERYYDGTAEELQVNFVPMMCQQCNNAPCEPVCPVYATYHNEEGLNAMIYNRCVGTRYCNNNCSYKVRRFNWWDHTFPEPSNWQLNPDVTKRTMGIMEKCTFCVQRISEAKDRAKDLGRLVADGEVKPACVQSCPTQALTFGNLKDKDSEVSKMAGDERAYKVLDRFINTQPSVTYLNRVKVEA